MAEQDQPRRSLGGRVVSMMARRSELVALDVEDITTTDDGTGTSHPCRRQMWLYGHLNAPARLPQTGHDKDQP